MKKYKWLLCPIIIFSIVIIIAACADGDKSAEAMLPTVIFNPETTETTTVETTTEEIIPEVPTYETADDLYNLIMANKSVWERDGMVNGTLIDLDYDGVPEFILMHGGERDYQLTFTAFKFTGDTMQEIVTIDNLYAEGVFKEIKAIIPYTDDDGVNRWIIPYVIYNDDSREYYFSAFDFADADLNEKILFNSKFYSTDYTREDYFGYEYLRTEFYIDGIEHKASQEKLDAFQLELDEYMREYDRVEAEGKYAPHVPWDCGQFFPNPSQEEWEEMKYELLKTATEIHSAYNLFPAMKGDIIDYHTVKSWGTEKPLLAGLKELTAAYIDGNEEYFASADLFYNNQGAMCKPVIYLYPTEPTDVKVRVSFPQGVEFTCTYPDYGDGWNVTAYPDGTVINKADGLEYSYLYWEAEGYDDWDLSSGFVVKCSDTAAFLQEKLAYLGLTPREYNEFIVYWLPLMQNNNYNLITFQTTQYEESSNLFVSPQPNSMLRVFMAYKPLDTAIEIPEQILEKFDRTGFSVIEWGGTCVE